MIDFVPKPKSGYKLVKSLFGKYEEIPEEWTLSDFKNLVFFQEGPGLRHWQFKEFGMKVINVTNLVGEFLDLSNTNRHIDIDEFEKNYKHFAVDEGDIVLASSGNSYGKISIVRKQDLPLMMNTSVIRLKPKSDKIDYRYLIQFLKSMFFRKQIDLLITGAAQPNFGPSHLDQLKIKTPDIIEQQKIASILYNIDELINKYDHVIESTKKLKRGLMQQLLTKGIGHKKFKKVKWLFGKEIEIPDTWNYAKIKNISTKLVVGFVGTCNPFYTDSIGVPMLRTTNVKEGKLDLSNLKYITREFHEKNMKSQVFENDLLVSRHGENGEACLVRNLKEANCLNTVIIRCNKDIFLPDFFETSFNSLIVRKQIQRTTAGGVQGVVNTGEIAKVKIIIPSLEEQQKTASILSAVDDVISDLESKKKSLEFIKKGLMQKLLTGQIRVKV